MMIKFSSYDFVKISIGVEENAVAYIGKQLLNFTVKIHREKT